MTQQAFAVGVETCVDFVNADGRGHWTHKTLAEIQADYPGAVLVDFKAWTLKHEKSICTEPKEITEDRFFEMLEVLPPQRWHQGRDCESFELSEHQSGRVTSIFCRFGNRYFEFLDVCGQSLAAHATHCGQVAEGGAA